MGNHADVQSVHLPPYLEALSGNGAATSLENWVPKGRVRFLPPPPILGMFWYIKKREGDDWTGYPNARLNGPTSDSGRVPHNFTPPEIASRARRSERGVSYFNPILLTPTKWPTPLEVSRLDWLINLINT